MATPIIKPTVILPDTSPLVHLAAVDSLPILNGLGRVVVADVVVLEATYDLSKPYAREMPPGSMEAANRAATFR